MLIPGDKLTPTRKTHGFPIKDGGSPYPYNHHNHHEPLSLPAMIKHDHYIPPITIITATTHHISSLQGRPPVPGRGFRGVPADAS